MFTIQSASSSSLVRFRDLEGDNFTVEVETYPVTARARVSAFAVGDGLARWFGELGVSQLPWKGSREWASMERDFIISATCASNGRIAFTIDLSGLPGSYEEWHVSVGLSSELGLLPSIGETARHFFAGA